MGNYKTKSVDVEAIQLEKDAELFGQVVPAGHWLVQRQGSLHSYSDEEFKDQFEEVSKVVIDKQRFDQMFPNRGYPLDNLGPYGLPNNPSITFENKRVG